MRDNYVDDEYWNNLNSIDGDQLPILFTKSNIEKLGESLQSLKSSHYVVDAALEIDSNSTKDQLLEKGEFINLFEAWAAIVLNILRPVLYFKPDEDNISGTYISLSYISLSCISLSYISVDF